MSGFHEVITLAVAGGSGMKVAGLPVSPGATANSAASWPLHCGGVCGVLGK